jgi:5'-deoxynucleotidase YfbR-like HD superfamily hydrolase
MTPVIRTYTGKLVNPTNLTPDMIDIHDIAHALALINRFVRHTSIPISVAQHSTFVSFLCEAAGYDKETALQGLLHDASEAYLGDVSTWVKAIPEMTAYRDIEGLVQDKLYTHFGLSREHQTRSIAEVDGMFTQVRRADRIMLQWEGSEGLQGFKFSNETEPFPEWTNAERTLLVSNWYPVQWQTAENMFLKQFNRITKARRL